MENNLHKTYTFNNVLNKKNIIESFNNFKDTLINEKDKDNAKFILLTITLIKETSKKSGENLSIEIIDNFKINTSNKNFEKLNLEINKRIKILRNYGEIGNLNTIIFNEIKFTYSNLTYYQYINKEDYTILLNKMIKRF